MILIVDDDKTIRMSLRLLMRSQGIEAECAASPDEALEMVRRRDYDLVILDMNYSRATTGEEGLELLRKVRIFQPDTPVILFTAWGSIDLAVEGMWLGAFDFITKPFVSDLFMQRVHTALDLRARGGGRLVSQPEEGSQTRRHDVSGPAFDRCGIIGENPELLALLDTVRRIAPTDAPVLILGENGTGKELVANAIHVNSRRAKGPFVKVNLGGVSTSLFESELFGHVKGAYTGAVADRKGSFQLADKGTVFLDEIGDLDPASQVKMLRVLQEHTFQALGDSRVRHADIRTVCATNADLYAMVADRSFREDLFYRINLITLRLPALRERRDDIPLLVRHFLRTLSEANGLPVPEVSAEAMTWLAQLPYPGNIRELRNMTERALLLKGGHRLEKDDFQLLPPAASASTEKNPRHEGAPVTLEEMERQAIEEALRRFDGNLSKAALSLGITRQSLYRRMEKLDIRP